MSNVALYDTTLRDGTQGEGISLSVADKLAICRRLDELGVHYIEGGWPGSNPRDAEFFERAKSMTLANATLTAFGSTRRANISASEDANLAALLEAETPVVTLVGKSWDLHVTRVLGNLPRREPSHDFRFRGVSGRAGQARILRRGALLRRLQG